MKKFIIIPVFVQSTSRLYELGAKLMEKERTEDLMEMLGLKETAVQMAKANGVRWYGHVLRRDDGHILRKALKFEVMGKRKPGQPKKTWKMQVEKESK